MRVVTEEPRNGNAPDVAARTPWRPLFAAAALPLPAALAFAGQFRLSLRTGPLWTTIVPGVVLYLAAFALLVAARFGDAYRTGPEDGDRATPRFLPPRVEWTLVAILVAGGLFLRLWAIDVVPSGLNNDEAINAIEAN